MAQNTVNVSGIDVANDKPFVLFGGMNVLESPELAMEVAEAYVEVLNVGLGNLLSLIHI